MKTKTLICIIAIMMVSGCENENDGNKENGKIALSAASQQSQTSSTIAGVEKTMNEKIADLESRLESASAEIDSMKSSASVRTEVVDSTGLNVGHVSPRGVMTDNGYILAFLKYFTGIFYESVYYEQYVKIYFVTDDCSGKYYHSGERGEILSVYLMGYYYIPKEANKILIDYKSFTDSGINCVKMTGSGYHYEIFQNDIAITEIDPSKYTEPFKYSIP